MQMEVEQFSLWCSQINLKLETLDMTVDFRQSRHPHSQLPLLFSCTVMATETCRTAEKITDAAQELLTS